MIASKKAFDLKMELLRLSDEDDGADFIWGERESAPCTPQKTANAANTQGLTQEEMEELESIRQMPREDRQDELKLLDKVLEMQYLHATKVPPPCRSPFQPNHEPSPGTQVANRQTNVSGKASRVAQKRSNTDLILTHLMAPSPKPNPTQCPRAGLDVDVRRSLSQWQCTPPSSPTATAGSAQLLSFPEEADFHLTDGGVEWARMSARVKFEQLGVWHPPLKFEKLAPATTKVAPHKHEKALQH